MVYKKLKLEINQEPSLEKTAYIFKRFKEGLSKKNCRYPHFSYYGKPKDNNEYPPFIKIKFDFLGKDGKGEQEGIEIADELFRDCYISDYDKRWSPATKHEWLMLAHNLASECILLLMENSKYLQLVQNKPYKNPIIKQSFGPSFTKLFFNKLAKIDIPIDTQCLQYYRDTARSTLFNEYIEKCVEITKRITKEKILYFANQSIIDSSNDWDFRMRFLHFIPLCSLTDLGYRVANIDFSFLFYKLISGLRLNITSSEIEVGNKIAQMINPSDLNNQ